MEIQGLLHCPDSFKSRGNCHLDNKAIVESKNQTLMQIHRDEFTAMRAEMLDSLCSDVADLLMDYIGWAKPVY